MDDLWTLNDCDKDYDAEIQTGKGWTNWLCIRELALWYTKSFSSRQDIRKQESLYI